MTDRFALLAKNFTDFEQVLINLKKNVVESKGLVNK